jgi:hypothetical protein
MMPSISEQELLSPIPFMMETAIFLWKDWPKDMKARTIDYRTNQFSLSGTCPHPQCSRPSVFILKTSAYEYDQCVMAVLQCQGCFLPILGIVENIDYRFKYVTHYPLGSPNDTVAEEIPEHIAEDFREALRCQFAKAYNATAEMCRRALEAACLERGAPKNKVLQKMIDSLESARIITPGLRDAAHTIRLGGDRGAHPPEDGPRDSAIIDGPIEKITEGQAWDIVNFTRHFFEFVYVIPAQLLRNNYSRSGKAPL